MVTEKKEWNNINLLLLNYSFVQLPSACLWFCWKVLNILAKGLFKWTWICGLSLSRLKFLSEAREMAQWAKCSPYRHEDLSSCPQNPCKKSGSGIPVTPALGRVKNAPLCVHTQAHTGTTYAFSNMLSQKHKKTNKWCPAPDIASFFPRLTAHREIILATRPSQNRALYIMEKSSHKPCQIPSSKHRSLPPRRILYPTSVLTSPSSTVCSCLFVSFSFTTVSPTEPF